MVTGACVVIEPQAQVIYQGVQRMILPPLTVRACHNRGDDIQTRLGLHANGVPLFIIPTLI